MLGAPAVSSPLREGIESLDGGTCSLPEDKDRPGAGNGQHWPAAAWGQLCSPAPGDFN